MVSWGLQKLVPFLRANMHACARMFGLRGAIPIYLAIIPVMLGLSGHYFNIAFIIVLCSLFLQGRTIRPVAKLLGVERSGAGSNER
jgi:potassium/hydrogen antiporter